MGSYTSRELYGDETLFKEVWATNIGCYLNRIDKAYKPYADVFLKEESKNFNGEHIMKLYSEEGDAGINDFLVNVIKVSGDHLEELLKLCKKFLECRCMHPYLEFWQKPGLEVIFDPVCMDCKRDDGSVGPDTDGSLEVKGNGKSIRLERQVEIQKEEIVYDASEYICESEMRVTENMIRLKDKGATKTDLHEGDSIEGNFQNRGIWYPGRIICDHGDKTYDIAYDNFTSDEEIGKRSQRRGVTIQFLLDFTNNNNCWKMTTREVRRKFIIPATEKSFCRYVELESMKNDLSKTGPADTYISYCWEAPCWGDMVSAVCDGCKGADRLRRCVWVDLFAFRQWPNNEPDIRFGLTIRHCSSLLVACSSNEQLKKSVDNKRRLFRNTSGMNDVKKRVALFRVWVLAEINTAAKIQDEFVEENKKIVDEDKKRYFPIVLKAGSMIDNIDGTKTFKSDQDFLDKLRGYIDIRDAETTVPADKSMIIDDIIKSHGVDGMDKLNRRIEGIVAAALSYTFDAEATKNTLEYSSTTICAAFGDVHARNAIMSNPDFYLPYICGGGFTKLLRDVIATSVAKDEEEIAIATRNKLSSKTNNKTNNSKGGNVFSAFSAFSEDDDDEEEEEEEDETVEAIDNSAHGGSKSTKPSTTAINSRFASNDNNRPHVKKEWGKVRMVTRGWNLLMRACCSGDRECADLLLQNVIGLKKDFINQASKDTDRKAVYRNNKALGLACNNRNLECVKLLIEKEAITYKGKYTQYTTRHGNINSLTAVACLKKDATMLKCLLEAGCDIAATGKRILESFNNCFEIAIKFGAIDCMKYLLSEMNNSYAIDAKNLVYCRQNKDEWYKYTSYNENPSSLDLLEMVTNEQYRCSICFCNAKDCINPAVPVSAQKWKLQFLTSCTPNEGIYKFCSPDCYVVSTWGDYVDVNWRDPATGRTALMNVCMGGLPDLNPVLHNLSPEKKSEINAKNNMHARTAGKSAEVLLYRGSDVNAVNSVKDDKGENLTPLLYACLYNSVYCVESLVKRKADKSIPDKLGRTPLMVACFNNFHKVARLLLKDKDKSCNVKAKYTDKDMTLIECACSMSLIKIVRLLIEHKALETEKEVQNCIEIAKGIPYPKQASILGLLSRCVYNEISKAFILDVSDTALMVACREKDVDEACEEVKFLLEFEGCDVNLADKDGTTPLKIAEDRNCIYIADLLKEACGECPKNDNDKTIAPTTKSGGGAKK